MRGFCRAAQRRDLTRGEPPITTAWQIAQRHGPERDATQSPHPVAEGITVAFNLVLAALRKRQSQQCRLAPARQDFDVERPRGAVVQHHAAPPALERSGRHAALHLRLVDPRQTVTRM